MSAPSLRRRSLAEILVVAVALVAIAVRAIEMPPTSLGIARIVFSVLAIAFVCFAPIQTIARRAIAVVIAEALVGVLAFAFVDVPLVVDHQRQIGTMAIAITQSVDRLERETTLRP